MNERRSRGGKGQAVGNDNWRGFTLIELDASTIYHFPGNYHGQISNFAFLDGHTEVHKWRDGLFNNPQPPPANWHDHTGNVAKPSSLTDLAWLKEHATLRQ